MDPLTTALQNIKGRHLHDIGTANPDERQFLKSWRRSLQELQSQQNSKILEFLVTDELTQRCSDILAKYSKPSWSFTSSTRDLQLPVESLNEEAGQWIEAEIGIATGELREHQRKAIRLYVATATALASAEEKLQEKLQRLELVASRVDELMFLESSPSMEALAPPALAYLQSVYEKLNIEKEYRELTKQYARFSQLRELVSLASFQRPSGAPICTICMTKEVCQAVTPCGHTFCDDCCGKQLTGCFICRVQIRDRLRLYFS